MNQNRFWGTSIWRWIISGCLIIFLAMAEIISYFCHGEGCRESEPHHHPEFPMEYGGAKTFAGMTTSATTVTAQANG